LIKHFRYIVYLYVFIGYGLVLAGSYEDFFRAIKVDDVAAVTDLLQRGFDVNTPDPNSSHALAIALSGPSPKVVQLLLTWPATHIDQRNAQDETPLMMAALRGNLAAARALIDKDADVNKTGWTPLHYAATNGHLDVMQLLLEHHAYIDAESPNGSTPLMMAALYGSAAAVKLLLDAGADPQLKNQLQLSALDFAKSGSHEESAALIDGSMRGRRAQAMPIKP
jgi:ankyrin repeat protein